jgi:murein DD-endopeptidase MepM/ murein hydrolase activator NlpD
MIHRRALLTFGATLAAAAQLKFARAAASRLSFSGSEQEGGLVIGHAEPDAKVTVDGNAVSLSPAGIFAFGFSYDRTNPARVAVRYADGTVEDRDVAPGLRQYQTQAINGLPQQEVTPPSQILARIHREALMIDAARRRNTAGSDFANGLDWPAHGIISSVYGSRRVLDGTLMAPHLGVDIAAPEGTPIHAPADGVVSLAGDYYLDGGFTLLDHGQGVSTCYVHQSRRMVQEGDRVARGQLIGLMGQTGRATGPNLHWGLNWFQIKLDPSLSTPTPTPPKI